MVKQQEQAEQKRLVQISRMPATHKEKIAGLILLYQAFVMADHTRSEFGSVKDIPETYSLWA